MKIWGGILISLLLALLCATNLVPSPKSSAAHATATLTPQAYLPLVTATYAPPPSDELVDPNSIVYVGAFRLPDDGERPHTFEYGGNAMTFNSDNNSLFIMGHDRIAYGDLPDGNQVAEVNIPTPINSRNLDDLSTATFIQGFHNVTQGYFTNVEEIPRVGMAYLNHPDTRAKIHLGWGQHMPPENNEATHGWFNPNLSNPDFQGVWHIGQQNYNSVNGYLLTIPTTWADAHVQGRLLATGRYRDGGWSGMGPALFAYRPWQTGGVPPPTGTRLNEIPLLLYANSQETETFERALNNYQHPDEWEGGAWLITPSGNTALLFAGTKSTGAKYWYGWVNPAGAELPCVEAALIGQFTLCRLADGTPCPPEDLQECAGHNDFRGWWSSRFDAQFILYNPADLAQVAAGQLEPWQPQPYMVMDIDAYLYFTPPAWEQDMLGRGDQRRQRIGDVTFDPATGRLYVLELYADGAKPVVHVWQIP